ncbi:T9SS type A sorting domain-containing protein [Labilibacter marinus]|uniref:T9SS type A sorting domain-containing protein n=1 Tax=Labilibacter marinus TaxID=1477105 RepID=UPI00082D1BF1|nr:T9SS type A sorting domain-containing protein [Labilibacter marinus]
MKKIYTLITALVFVFSANSQTSVLEEDFNNTGTWYTDKQIQWDANWMGVSNNKGWIANGNGQIIGFGWRGGTESATPLSSWAVDETVTITVNVSLDFTPDVIPWAPDPNPNPIDAKLVTRTMSIFGLTADITAGGGQNQTTASTHNANTLGFHVKFDAETGESGTMNFLSSFDGAVADGISVDAENIGLYLRGLTTPGVASGDLTAPHDLVGDNNTVIYQMTKTATSGEFSVALSVNGSVVGPFTVTNSTIYDATDAYFTACSDDGGFYVSLDDFNIERNSIPLNATEAIIDNSNIYVASNTLYINDTSAKEYIIYNLSGSVIKQGQINGGQLIEPLPINKGLYIVKVGSKTQKIIVK